MISRGLPALLLIWGGLLLAVFSGRMYTTDVLAQYEVAGSFAGQRSLLTVSGRYGWTVEGVRPGPFVPHGIGFSLLLIPSSIAGGAFGLNAGKLVMAFTNLLFSLVLVGSWYVAAEKKYGQVPVGRFLLVAIGSMALVYGKITFDVTAAAAALMTAYALYLFGLSAGAGIAFGLAVLIRSDSILFLPLFLGSMKEMKRFASGAVPLLLLILMANHYRFGSPFSDGHSQDPAIALDPFQGGIPGLLASPGKGLFLYAPLTIVAIFYQREWRLWLPCALSLVFHGMLHDWTGGTGWGPRFLFTCLPFLLMPLTRKGTGGGWFRAAAVAAVLVTLPALWSNPSHIEQAAGADLFGDPSRQAVIWKPGSSPLLLTAAEIGRGSPDILASHAASGLGFPVPAAVILQFAAGGILVAAGFRKLNSGGEAEIA